MFELYFLFQFLIGRLKHEWVFKRIIEMKKFQFLIGRLKPRDTRQGGSRAEGFNSL